MSSAAACIPESFEAIVAVADARHPSALDIAVLDALQLQAGQRMLGVAAREHELPMAACRQAVGSSGRIAAVRQTEPDPARATIVRPQHGSARGPGVPCTVYEADIGGLPFRNACFNAVCAHEVLGRLGSAERCWAAVRDCVRVVRPGGVLALVETDWAGLRADHAQRQAFESILQRARRGLAAPDLALGLGRALGLAGLVDVRRTVVARMAPVTTLMREAGLDLAAAAREAVRAGELPLDTARTVLLTLAQDEREGRSHACVMQHVVWGRAPG